MTHSMELPNMPTVPYVRCARFKTGPEARAIYARLRDECMRDRKYDIGIVAIFENETIPLVVVTAFAEPPEDAQKAIDSIISGGQSYDIDPETVEAIIIRRLRQMLSDESTHLPDGFVQFRQEGEYRMVDRYGRDVK